MMKKLPNPFAHLLLMAAFLFVDFAHAAEDDAIKLPELGSSADQYMTPLDEVKLGKEFMMSVRRTGTVVDDSLLSEYVENLGGKLQKQSDAAGLTCHFFIIDQPDINAFAGPGCHIGINSGLILATQSESELASVVAHELAHITQKHLLRAFEAANEMSGKTAALLLASILVGVAGSPDAGIAMATGVQANAIQEQISFTRSNEKEADTVGIRILANSDFDPRAMPVFFERLTHASRLYESGIPEILRTHPVTTNRIADALGRAEEYAYRQYPGNLSYFLTREALRFRSFKEPELAVKHFATGLKEGRHLNEEAYEYGYVLALTANREYDKARVIADKLLKAHPEQPEYVLASAQIYQDQGDHQQAIKLLDTYYSLMPDNYPIALRFVEFLTQAGKLDQARTVALQSLELRSDDPVMVRRLSKIEEMDGHQAESHRLLAEAYVIDGALRTAVNQLEIALNEAEKSDFYLVSKIESRLGKLREVLKSSQADEL
ncbi:MAG: M48 family metalloprotease [Candidatus Thiodiazotropha sp.]